MNKGKNGYYKWFYYVRLKDIIFLWHFQIVCFITFPEVFTRVQLRLNKGILLRCINEDVSIRVNNTFCEMTFVGWSFSIHKRVIAWLNFFLAKSGLQQNQFATLERKRGRVNLRKDFRDCCKGLGKNWPIADQRVPSNDPTRNCGTHFGSSLMLSAGKYNGRSERTREHLIKGRKSKGMHPEASTGKYSVAIGGKDLTARKGRKILSSTTRIVRKDAHIDVDVVLFLTG